MFRSRILAIALAVFGAAAFALLGVALAPATSATAPAISAHRVGAQSSASYSDDELQAFAEAALEVRRIKAAYLPKLQAAETADEETALKQAATGEMKRAIEERGLDVDKYHEILVAALTDDEVAQRVGRYMTGLRA